VPTVCGHLKLLFILSFCLTMNCSISRLVLASSLNLSCQNKQYKSSEWSRSHQRLLFFLPESVFLQGRNHGECRPGCLTISHKLPHCLRIKSLLRSSRHPDINLTELKVDKSAYMATIKQDIAGIRIAVDELF